jgi:hypothetical protein
MKITGNVPLAGMCHILFIYIGDICRLDQPANLPVQSSGNMPFGWPVRLNYYLGFGKPLFSVFVYSITSWVKTPRLSHAVGF